MNKTNTKTLNGNRKIALNKETIKGLSATELTQVAGGGWSFTFPFLCSVTSPN